MFMFMYAVCGSQSSENLTKIIIKSRRKKCTIRETEPFIVCLALLLTIWIRDYREKTTFI